MGTGSRMPPANHLSTQPGCNADSETCNYCRLSESTEGKESSTEDDRGLSPTAPSINENRRRLSRALSEEYNPPSRPIRRTSPGEYLRHKRDQMEKLRSEKLRDLPLRKQRPSFQRCDSDPRLSRKHRDSRSPSRTLTFVSPTRNRVRRTCRKKSDPDEVPSDRNVIPIDSPVELEKPRRSALAKNLTERHSRSKERRSSIVWSADESTPFIQRRASFRCAVCDCDIPFTNCVLCNAEAKGAYFPESSTSEFFINENDLISLNAEDFVIEGECVQKTAELTLEVAQSEKKELEEFYDRPTPVELPSLPTVQPSPLEKRTQWTSKGSIHKSFNQEEYRSARRSSLRKYYSEPVPETEDFHYSGEQSEAGTPSSQKGMEASEQRDFDSSASNSSKSESRAGYHVAKDSPQKDAPQQKEKKSSCLVCGKTSEDEDKNLDVAKSRSVSPDATTDEKNQRSPSYLKPHFDFEPEIIHKANPLVDEAEVDVHPSAAGAFRRLSEEEFISTLNIHDAARKGDLHVVKLLTKKDPKQMETVDERGWTPIHLAAAQGHTEVVKYLAMEGAHLAALDPSSYTALHLAAMNGHNSILEVLLPLGVDVDSVTAEGFTALHLAVMNTHLECIQTLLQWGASLDKKDALGRGIHDMIEEYNLQEVATLLRRFHKQLHNFKHMLDMMNREGRSSSDIPREYMDILASIAEESGTE